MGPRVGRCGRRVDAQALPGTRRHVARFALHATRRHRGPRHARTTRASPVPQRVRGGGDDGDERAHPLYGSRYGRACDDLASDPHRSSAARAALRRVIADRLPRHERDRRHLDRGRGRDGLGGGRRRESRTRSAARPGSASVSGGRHSMSTSTTTRDASSPTRSPLPPSRMSDLRSRGWRTPSFGSRTSNRSKPRRWKSYRLRRQRSRPPCAGTSANA